MACSTPPEDSPTGPNEAGDSGADARPRTESAQPDSRTATAEGIVPDRLFRIDPDLAPGLYIVSTPIGNLRDITLRALDVLASVDMVCAEDTRVTAKLLSSFGASARLRPYHDHNAARERPELLAALRNGARIALVSDAGTPLVSDPGYKLVREASGQGSAVFAVPGASAPLAALSVAGLPTDRFLFAGFPPPKQGARRRMFASLTDVRATLIFFEGPSRLAESLADLAAELGDREAVVARELTKKFEEARRGDLGALAAHYAEAGPPRGEIVIVVGPPHEAVADADALEAAICAASPDAPAKTVAADIAARFGVSRRDVYQRLLELREADDGHDKAD